MEPAEQAETSESHNNTVEVSNLHLAAAQIYCDLLADFNLSREDISLAYQNSGLEGLRSLVVENDITAEGRTIILDLDGVFTDNTTKSLLLLKIDSHALELLRGLVQTLPQANFAIITSRPLSWTRKAFIFKQRETWQDKLISALGENTQLIPIAKANRGQIQETLSDPTFRAVFTNATKKWLEWLALAPDKYGETFRIERILRKSFEEIRGLIKPPDSRQGKFHERAIEALRRGFNEVREFLYNLANPDDIDYKGYLNVVIEILRESRHTTIVDNDNYMRSQLTDIDPRLQNLRYISVRSDRISARETIANAIEDSTNTAIGVALSRYLGHLLKS